MKEIELQNIIWKFTLYLISNRRIYYAFIGVFYLSISGVSNATIGWIFFVGSLASLILELPSGYIADRIGHKQALLIAKGAFLISTLFLLFATGIPFLFLAAFFMNIGHAFHSGTASAFMHDTLQSLGKEKSFVHIMGKMKAWSQIIPLILTATIPFLLTIDYHLPFLVMLLVDIVGFLALLSITSPQNTSTKVEVNEIGIQNFKNILKEARAISFYRYALFFGILSGALIALVGFRSQYQEFIGIPIIWFGMLFALGRLISSALLFYSKKIYDSFGTIQRYTFFLFIFFLVLLGSLFLPSPWSVAIIFIVLNASQWGLDNVTTTYLLERIPTSKNKATLLSLEGQFREISSGLFALGMGYSIHILSYPLAFLFSSLFLGFLLFPFLLSILLDRKTFYPLKSHL